MSRFVSAGQPLTSCCPSMLSTLLSISGPLLSVPAPPSSRTLRRTRVRSMMRAMADSCSWPRSVE
jgi:hypothetical protein